MDDVVIFGLSAQHAIFRGAKLTNVYAEAVDFRYAYLSEAQLIRSIFNDSLLNFANFTASKIKLCDFTRADFTSANLNDAKISSSSFHNSKFNKASLARVSTDNSFFKGANFTEANLANHQSVNDNFEGAIGN